MQSAGDFKSGSNDLFRSPILLATNGGKEIYLSGANPSKERNLPWLEDLSLNMALIWVPLLRIQGSAKLRSPKVEADQ